MPFSMPLKVFSLCTTLLLSTLVHSQTPAPDTSNIRLYVKGAVSVTNNGFSFIPSFSLGKPATIVNLFVSHGNRFSFEPEFRYSLMGKPWSFIFIWRYKLIKTEQFQFTLGTHLPALSFRTSSVVKNGINQDVIESLRFFPVVEVAPSYSPGKNANLGIFYLYGRGADPGISKNTHFLSVRAGFSHIPITDNWHFKFSPQLYYLKADVLDGFYTAASFILSRRNFPLSISFLVNKSLNTEIAGKKFDWNVSLNYNFGRNYTGEGR